MPKIGWSEQDKICVDMLATLNLGWIKVIVDLSDWIFCCKTAENSYFPEKKAIFWHPKMEKLPSEIALRQRRSVFLRLKIDFFDFAKEKKHGLLF